MLPLIHLFVHSSDKDLKAASGSVGLYLAPPMGPPLERFQHDRVRRCPLGHTVLPRGRHASTGSRSKFGAGQQAELWSPSSPLQLFFPLCGLCLQLRVLSLKTEYLSLKSPQGHRGAGGHALLSSFTSVKHWMGYCEASSEAPG